MSAAAAARKMSLLLLVIALSLELCQSADLQRVYSQRVPGPSDEVVMLPKKRPFCNAFTGCGRKRSGSSAPAMSLPELLRQRQLAEEDTLSNILDLSDDSSAQEISRQLLSEAKMLEAIQEAGAELYRRKQMANYPVPYNMQ